MSRLARIPPGAEGIDRHPHRTARCRSKPELRRAAFWCALAVLCASAAGCDGPQSALAPAGRGAERLAELFWWMVAGASLIWTLVIGLAIQSVRLPPAPHPRRVALFIIGGGVVFPTVVLAGLLSYGLALLPDLLAPAPPGSLTISVTGEQWWWRVRYERPDGEPITVANEIHLPVGEPVEFRLDSPDVIHAFWIPSLGSKVDMIPGRQTRLALYPTKTGVFRGVCAEYCGASHALMAFDVVIQEPEEFARWLEHQAAPAETPLTSLAERGQQVFLANGCGACHTVRGIPANGVVGPDLTHVGGRLTLAAGTTPNDVDQFLRWIAQPGQIKPGVHMPAFGMLPDEDLRALAAWLDGLE